MPSPASTAMADAHDALSMFAQVAVAIAGFSGMVIAFGQRSWGSLTKLELCRLSNLLALSGVVLLTSILGASLLPIGPMNLGPDWRGQSAIALVLGAFWLAVDWRMVSRLQETERSKAKHFIFYPFNLIASFGLFLQLANIFLIGEAWPFLLGLVAVVTIAFQQFILLVRMGFRNNPAAEVKRPNAGISDTS